MKIRKAINTKMGVTSVVIGIFAAAALGIAVTAGIPDENGLIHACYKANNGQVRIVESDAECKNNETAIQWNQTGVQGPEGPQGPQGPPGAGSGPSGSVTDPNTLGTRPSIIAGCSGYNPQATILTLPVTLTESSTIHVFGNLFPFTGTGLFNAHPMSRAELLSGDVVVAKRDGSMLSIHQRPPDNQNSDGESVVAGPLLDGSGNAVYVAAPGSYLLRLVLTTNGARFAGDCGVFVTVTSGSVLSFQAFAAP